MIRFEFHPDAVEHNLLTIRRLARGGVERCGVGCSASPAVCAIIKANGYRLGAARLIPAIERTGTEMVGVFSTEEARDIAQLVGGSVLVLGPAWDLEPDDLALSAALRSGRLHVVVHGRAHLDQLSALGGRLGASSAALPVHIEVDTGLGRGGAGPQEARELVAELRGMAHLRLAGVMTHFSDASLPGGRAGDQERAFAGWVASLLGELPHDCLIHQASTTTLFAGSGRLVDMIRIGLGMFGCAGVSDGDPTPGGALRGAITLRAPIVLVREVPAGSPIGYGGTFVTARETRLALVPVGYAHGYPREHRGGQGVVLGPDGKRYAVPILGRVGMDQMAIDATDVPVAALGTAGRGAMVELIGHEPVGPTSLASVAACGGMIPHELICRLGAALRPAIVRGRALGVP